MAAIVITRTDGGYTQGASGNVATYTTRSIGAEDPSRIVVVLVGTNLSGATINSCTINSGGGAQSMTAGSLGNFGNVYARAFYLAVPTGTTATIAVTYGANPSGIQNGIAVYRVINALRCLSSGSDGSTDMDSTDPLTTGSITIGTDEGFLACAACNNPAVNKGWSNATEDLDSDKGEFTLTSAIRTTPGTVEITCIGGANEDGALSWLLFTPTPETPPARWQNFVRTAEISV